MANAEHVERLKSSVNNWNKWRKQNKNIKPDLSSADLSAANLAAADLCSVDLRNANLYKADLRSAYLINTDLYSVNLISSNLIGANFRNAYLSLADLSLAELLGAEFEDANLVHACLQGTNLKFANLKFANLSGADLRDTDFSHANLQSANLSGADLRSANLSLAQLHNTNFCDANLSGSNLNGADLTKANFTNVILNDTFFTQVNLCNVRGLEAVQHRGPSIVNINSVILPLNSKISTHFLRGVGFTEIQIEYLPSLLNPRPIQYHSLFISYAHQDEDLANQLHTYLRKNNVPCWFAPHDMRPGNYVRDRIDQAIHTQDKLLLLLSDYSVNSGWVRYEVELALARENSQQREILFPLRLDDAVFSCTAGWATSLRNTRHIGDFTGWQNKQRYQEACATLLRHLRSEDHGMPKV